MIYDFADDLEELQRLKPKVAKLKHLIATLAGALENAPAPPSLFLCDVDAKEFILEYRDWWYKEASQAARAVEEGDDA